MKKSLQNVKLIGVLLLAILTIVAVSCPNKTARAQFKQNVVIELEKDKEISDKSFTIELAYATFKDNVTPSYEVTDAWNISPKINGGGVHC